MMPVALSGGAAIWDLRPDGASGPHGAQDGREDLGDV